MDLEGKFNDDVFRLGKTNRSSWGNKVISNLVNNFNLTGTKFKRRLHTGIDSFCFA
jgi:hypothetical protein